MSPPHKQHKHVDKVAEKPTQDFKPTFPPLQPSEDEPVPESNKVGRDPDFTFTPIFHRYQPLDKDGNPVQLDQWNRYEPDGTVKSRFHLVYPDVYKARDEPECWDDLSFVQDRLVKEAAINVDILQLVAQINRLALEVLEYHNVAQVPGAGQLPEALELAKKAFFMGDFEWHEKGVTFYTASKICQALYYCTGESSWLREAQDFGMMAVDWIRDREEKMPQDLFVRCLIARTEYLARTYKLRWGCDDATMTRDERVHCLNAAIANQGDSADWTCTVLCSGAEGWFLRDPADIKRWGCTRVIEFYKLLLILADYADLEPRWAGCLDKAINSIGERPCIADGDAEEQLYFVFLAYLYSRRWLTTRSEEHYQDFLTRARTWMKARALKGESDISSLDHNNDRDVLRYFHKVWTEYANEITGDISTRHLYIAYCKHLLSQYTPILTSRHNGFITSLLGSVDTACREIYANTKKVEDGLLVDDWSTRDTLFVNYVRVIDGFQAGQNHPLDPDEDMVSVVQSYPRQFLLKCHMTSVVNGQGFNVMTNWATRDVLDQALKFVREEGDGDDVFASFKMKRWIRDRSREDGSFLLGGAVPGRDDAVISFLDTFSAPKTAHYRAQILAGLQPHPDGNVDG